MKKLWVIALAALVGSGFVQAEGPSLEGTWSGKLGTPDKGLRVVFNVSEKEDGSLSATMDSPDQGAFGIGVSKVEHKGERWVFRIDMIQGKYEGAENEDGTVEGTWTQGPQTLPLILKRDGQKLKGIIAPGQNLTMVFRIRKDGDGYSAKLDSPDQGTTGIPVDSMKQDGDEVTMKVAVVKGKFTGKVKDGEISGTWSQGGVNFPLVLKPSTE